MTKVLVFETDHAFAVELRTELTQLGCTVQVFKDGNTGMIAAANSRPDLVLLSVELPRMNGFSVCNKLKKDPSLHTVPIIMMSTQSSAETFAQHQRLRTRAEDYVHKPVSFSDLLARIQRVVPMGAGPEIDDDETVGDFDDMIAFDAVDAQGMADTLEESFAAAVITPRPQAQPLSLDSGSEQDPSSVTAAIPREQLQQGGHLPHPGQPMHPGQAPQHPGQAPQHPHPPAPRHAPPAHAQATPQRPPPPAALQGHRASPQPPGYAPTPPPAPAHAHEARGEQPQPPAQQPHAQQPYPQQPYPQQAGAGYPPSPTVPGASPMVAPQAAGPQPGGAYPAPPPPVGPAPASQAGLAPAPASISRRSGTLVSARPEELAAAMPPPDVRTELAAPETPAPVGSASGGMGDGPPMTAPVSGQPGEIPPVDIDLDDDDDDDDDQMTRVGDSAAHLAALGLVPAEGWPATEATAPADDPALQQALHDARQQIESLRKQLAERGDPAAAGRELLKVREQLQAKDREILEARDRSLAMERRANEFQEQVTALQKSEQQLTTERDETRARLNQVEGDRALADKRATDFRDGAKKMAEQLNQRATELRDAQEKHRAEVSEQQQAHEQALREAADKHRAGLEHEQTEHAAALAKLRDEVEAAKAAQADERKTHQDAVAAKDEVLSEKEAALAETQASLQKTEARLAEQLQVQANALEETRRTLDEELSNAQANFAKQLEQDLAKLGASHVDTLKALREEQQRKQQEKAEAHQAALEVVRAEGSAALEEQRAQHGESLQRIGQRLQDREAASNTMKDEFGRRLSQEQEDRARLERDLQNARENIEKLEEQGTQLMTERDNIKTTVDMLTSKLSSSENALEQERARLTKARERWGRDLQALVEAKAALEMVMERMTLTDDERPSMRASDSMMPDDGPSTMVGTAGGVDPVTGESVLSDADALD